MIMLYDEKRPFLKFESIKPIEETLGERAGTFDWELNEAHLSGPLNSFYGELLKSTQVNGQISEIVQGMIKISSVWSV